MRLGQGENAGAAAKHGCQPRDFVFLFGARTSQRALLADCGSVEESKVSDRGFGVFDRGVFKPGRVGEEARVVGRTRETARPWAWKTETDSKGRQEVVNEAGARLADVLGRQSASASDSSTSNSSRAKGVPLPCGEVRPCSGRRRWAVKRPTQAPPVDTTDTMEAVG